MHIKDINVEKQKVFTSEKLKGSTSHIIPTINTLPKMVCQKTEQGYTILPEGLNFTGNIK